MASMSDSVNKIFTLHHEYGSMDMEGFRTREDAAIQLLRVASNRSIPPGCTPDEYWQHQIKYWQGMKLAILAELQRVEQEQKDEQADQHRQKLGPTASAQSAAASSAGRGVGVGVNFSNAGGDLEMFKPTDWSAVQFGCALAALIITAGCIKAGHYEQRLRILRWGIL